VVQSAILQKKLDFRRLFWLDFFATVAGGSVAITLALKGFGVWTLVFDMLIATTVRVLVMWITSGWRPRLRFDTSALRELFGFSGNLMASNAVTYWSRNFDTLLVGKYFGDVSAGIYNRAYQLMMLPMTQVTAVITRVMFPALAAIQNDVPRVRTVYLRATRIISLVTFPLMMLLMVLAEPTILFLYGEKWRASVPLFQILCVAAIAQSVGTTVSWIYSSQGRTDIQFKWILIATPLRITSFIVGIQWGVMGMTIAYVLTGYLITFYPSWSIPGRLIGLKFSEMVRNILPTFGCGVATAVLVWAIDILLLPPTFYPLRLAVGGSIGILAYLALLNAFHVQAWRDVSELVHGGHLPAARHITRFLPKYRTP
jgi:O-antigen/teichoic acid export membrane protein